MNIGEAIAALRADKHVARSGWNGKGMWLVLERFEGREPCITMHTAQGKLQPGWLASQADLLAVDWAVLDD